MSSRARHKKRHRQHQAEQADDPAQREAALREELAVEKARGELSTLIAAVERRFDDDLRKFHEVDDGRAAAEVEGKDIDFEGKHRQREPQPGDAGRAFDKVAKTGGKTALKVGLDQVGKRVIDKTVTDTIHNPAVTVDQLEHGVAATGKAAAKASWITTVVGAVKGVVDNVYTARHSKAHRAATTNVGESASQDMHAWADSMRARAGAARSIDELRELGQVQILPMLGAVRNQVQVVEQLHTWVTALEMQDASYTRSEAMDLLREGRTGLGESLEQEEKQP